MGPLWREVPPDAAPLPHPLAPGARQTTECSHHPRTGANGTDDHGDVALPGTPPVAVGTALTGGPPHRSQRAGLPHWAPTLGEWRRSVPRGRDALRGRGAATGLRS